MEKSDIMTEMHEQYERRVSTLVDQVVLAEDNAQFGLGFWKAMCIAGCFVTGLAGFWAGRCSLG